MDLLTRIRCNKYRVGIMTFFMSLISPIAVFASEPSGNAMSEYLEQVGTVFTWILGQITELITFILGNPFLAVSLVLFMCGAVISFYVRVKKS